MAIRWVQTVRETVRHYGVLAVVLVGLVLILAGALVKLGGPPDFNLPIILLGVGCSMVAAGTVSSLNPVTAELYERILSMGVSHVYPSRNDIEKKNWVDWLSSTNQRFVQVGISNSGWRTDTAIPPALRDRLRGGVEVKLFFLDPTSSAAGVRGNEESHRNTQSEIRDTIGYFWAHRESFNQDLRTRFKMYVYNATPSLGLTWTDDLMIATHLLGGVQKPNLTCPDPGTSPVPPHGPKPIQSLRGKCQDAGGKPIHRSFRRKHNTVRAGGGALHLAE